MGIFKGIDKAEVTGGSQYFLPGKYKVKVDVVKLVQSRKSLADLFVVETTVIESNNIERPSGSRASQVIKMGEVMSLPNIKKFLGAAVGVDATSASANDGIEKAFSDATGRRMSIEDCAEYVVSAENPMGEIELRLECVEIETKRGTPFTKHNWMSA